MSNLRSDLEALLIEVSELLDNYADVRDGDDGPRPNAAMVLQRDVDHMIQRLKDPLTDALAVRFG